MGVKRRRKKNPEAGEGLKLDAGKLRMDLLPPRALESVAAVLTYGAAKYAEENWRKVENAGSRYTAAALRHTAATMGPNPVDMDPESGLPHVAHAICCLMFKLELELESAGGSFAQPGVSLKDP